MKGRGVIYIEEEYEKNFMNETTTKNICLNTLVIKLWEAPI